VHIDISTIDKERFNVEPREHPEFGLVHVITPNKAMSWTRGHRVPQPEKDLNMTDMTPDELGPSLGDGLKGSFREKVRNSLWVSFWNSRNGLGDDLRVRISLWDGRSRGGFGDVRRE